MSELIEQALWPFPDAQLLEGRYVRITRLNPDADVDDLYELSHSKEEYTSLWKYMHNGPFADKKSMHDWLVTLRDRHENCFYAVLSRELKRKVGMFAVMNVSATDARAELGNIWYSPVAQKTKVNTEVTYLFLRYLFDELRYRRIEWKCNNRNEASKRTALRMGFSFEGLFRQHMVVKGRSRDTAWYSMIDSEWPERKTNFEQFLTKDNISLTKLNSSTFG